MAEIELEVTHEAGLHLRPAALFVQTAAAFEATIEVRNVSRDTPFKNAKSALEVMMLGVNQGHRIAIRAEGEDAEEALEALRRLIESNFEVDSPAEEEEQ
ncbi:MAG TPA: HPr family phosphocarrier protein [Chloroflexi bacterium]|nr:HPr family phosphocarrier protein [Chloroflexota bacterium]